MATNPLATRRARSKMSQDKKIALWVEFFCATFVVLPVGAWVFMLTVGVIHHEWLPQLPTLGYWASLLIFFMIDWVITLMRYRARTVPAEPLYPAS